MRKASVLRQFLRSQVGTTAIEYALVAGLIFLALVTGLSVYGGSAGNLFGNLSTKLGAVFG